MRVHAAAPCICGRLHMLCSSLLTCWKVLESAGKFWKVLESVLLLNGHSCTDAVILGNVAL